MKELLFKHDSLILNQNFQISNQLMEISKLGELNESSYNLLQKSDSTLSYLSLQLQAMQFQTLNVQKNSKPVVDFVGNVYFRKLLNDSKYSQTIEFRNRGLRTADNFNCIFFYFKLGVDSIANSIIKIPNLSKNDYIFQNSSKQVVVRSEFTIEQINDLEDQFAYLEYSYQDKLTNKLYKNKMIGKMKKIDALNFVIFNALPNEEIKINKLYKENLFKLNQ